MPATVKVKSRGFKVPRQAVVRVGILETGDHPPGEAHEGGITIGELAETHEFGLGNVPARAPIRKYVDEHEAKLREIATREFTAAVATGAYQTAADRIAVKAAAGVRNVITEGLQPGLATSTEARKAARGIKPPYTPLVETGVLRSAYSGDAEVTE